MRVCSTTRVVASQRLNTADWVYKRKYWGKDKQNNWHVYPQFLLYGRLGKRRLADRLFIAD